MACKPYLRDEELVYFRTKLCNRISNEDECSFGLNRCQYSHNLKWPRRCPYILSSTESKRTLRYIPKLCLAVSKSGHHNSCKWGSECEYAHTQEEIDYHPLLYKSIACSEGSKCRFYCPFYHNLTEMRVPPDYIAPRRFNNPTYKAGKENTHPQIESETTYTSPLTSPQANSKIPANNTPIYEVSPGLRMNTSPVILPHSIHASPISDENMMFCPPGIIPPPPASPPMSIPPSYMSPQMIRPQPMISNCSPPINQHTNTYRRRMMESQPMPQQNISPQMHLNPLAIKEQLSWSFDQIMKFERLVDNHSFPAAQDRHELYELVRKSADAHRILLDKLAST